MDVEGQVAHNVAHLARVDVVGLEPGEDARVVAPTERALVIAELHDHHAGAGRAEHEAAPAAHEDGRGRRAGGTRGGRVRGGARDDAGDHDHEQRGARNVATCEPPDECHRRPV